MTAIDKFIRLEAVGYWFEPGRQEAREVIVSFGDASLQLTSLKDVPLTHWSLLATRRIGTRGAAVIYSADPDEHEILEIDDPEMNRAISAVTAALSPSAKPPARRRWLWRGVVLAVLLAGLSQTPPLVYNLAATLTPPSRMAAVSAEMQDDLRAQFGPECKGWLGQRALADFGKKLFPEITPEILVFDGMPQSIRALPASAVVLSRQVLENTKSPDELAALVALAWASGENGRPKAALIRALGPLGALRYLITGTFGQPLPEIELRPDGADFILARAHLQSIGASPASLRPLSEASGIGLPLPATTLPDFAFSDFETLRNICAE